jgi:hypothetical protein
MRVLQGGDDGVGGEVASGLVISGMLYWVFSKVF